MTRSRTLSFLFLVACGAPSSQSGGSPASPTRVPTQPSPGVPILLPADFVANRIFVHPVMADGRALTLFTDSAGGTCDLLFERTVKRLGLPMDTSKRHWDGMLGVVPIPAWAHAAIPPRVSPNQAPHERHNFCVMRAPRSMEAGTDGILGAGWFGGRVWTIDYPRRQMLWRADGDVPAHAPNEEVQLHMRGDPEGRSYGRVTIEVDGDPIDLLFDTGATVRLCPAASAALGDGEPAVRATSFIVATLFEQWRALHPEWRMIEGAESTEAAEPIMEVPSIRLAGRDVGPVWFTRRPDANFHEYMSADTDARVEGALGGSALQYFAVTVDYPRGLLVLQALPPARKQPG